MLSFSLFLLEIHPLWISNSRVEGKKKNVWRGELNIFFPQSFLIREKR